MLSPGCRYRHGQRGDGVSVVRDDDGDGSARTHHHDLRVPAILSRPARCVRDGTYQLGEAFIGGNHALALTTTVASQRHLDPAGSRRGPARLGERDSRARRLAALFKGAAELGAKASPLAGVENVECGGVEDHPA